MPEVVNVPKEQAEATRTPDENVSINTEKYLENTEIDGDITIVREESFSDIDFSFTEVPEAETVKSMLTNLSAGIFGMPYQFPEIVDSRLEGSEFGRKYAQKITSVMPVMFITPGEPIFMAGYSEKEKEGIMQMYGDDSEGLTVNDVLGDSSSAPFYTFNSRFELYSEYVNTMVRALSIFMGIGDERYSSSRRSKLKNFRLENILNEDFKGFFNASTSVAFYLDSDASVSESFSNSTTESMLSQKVNQYSDTAKELNFLFGSLNAGGIYDSMKSAVGDVSSALNKVSEHVGIGQSIIGRVTSGLTTVVSGGKMVFPEIWSGSDYSRNYNISMKLRSPDPDPLSIMLNIYIPLCCLTGLVMPVQMAYDANGYLSPFLVRATYKSIFNCELGIVSGLEISKGGEDKWNAAGMPTSVDVTMTIKDLYSTMFMSKADKNNLLNPYKGLMNNMAQLDYLALMAGIDMNKDWVFRKMKLKWLLEGSEIFNIPASVWQNFKEGANKTATRFLSRALGSDIRWNS